MITDTVDALFAQYTNDIRDRWPGRTLHTGVRVRHTETRWEGTVHRFEPRWGWPGGLTARVVWDHMEGFSRTPLGWIEVMETDAVRSPMQLSMFGGAA